MTWNETHERTRIIREVEAAAALDMTGALPWREEWGTYFDGPAGLVAALRARWNRMCEAQLDARNGEDEFQDTYNRLRRTQAGILAILRRAESGAVAAAPAVLALPGARHVASPRKVRRVRFHGGPTLPV